MSDKIKIINNTIEFHGRPVAKLIGTTSSLDTQFINLIKSLNDSFEDSDDYKEMMDMKRRYNL